jgi:hypothetical protein
MENSPWTLILPLEIPDSSQAWWFTTVILAFGRLRQEDHKFEVSLGYIVRPYLKKKSSKPTMILKNTRGQRKEGSQKISVIQLSNFTSF